MIISVLSFLLVFTIVVLVHEFGHFVVAKRLGFKIYEFSIGFPFSPKVATLFKHKETVFTLRLLPLGGFVGFSKEGGGGEAESPEYLRTERWKRALVASAGSILNIVFAFFLLASVFTIGNDMPFYEAAAGSVGTITAGFTATFKLLFGLVSGSGSMESLYGPIGIAAMAGKAAGAGLADFLYFTGMLSLSLGILNLLPLPMLDGGHLVILSVESLLRRPLSLKAYQVIGVAGISFFIIITLVVSYRDILRLVT